MLQYMGLQKVGHDLATNNRGKRGEAMQSGSSQRSPGMNLSWILEGDPGNGNREQNCVPGSH